VVEDSKRACGVSAGLLAVELPADATALAEVRIAASSGTATSCCGAAVAVCDAEVENDVLVGTACWSSWLLLIAGDAVVSLTISTASSATSCSVRQSEAAANLQMYGLSKNDELLMYLHRSRAAITCVERGTSNSVKRATFQESPRLLRLNLQQ
jgi:hypothetical protein